MMSGNRKDLSSLVVSNIGYAKSFILDYPRQPLLLRKRSGRAGPQREPDKPYCRHFVEGGEESFAHP